MAELLVEMISPPSPVGAFPSMSLNVGWKFSMLLDTFLYSIP